MALPFTQKILKDWAGWKAFRDGKMLFERGVVEKADYEHPFIFGQLAVGIRGMRCKFELLDDGFFENLCPCRDNQEKGLICAHMVALGLEAVRRYNDPQREAKAERKRRTRDPYGPLVSTRDEVERGWRYRDGNGTKWRGKPWKQAEPAPLLFSNPWKTPSFESITHPSRRKVMKADGKKHLENHGRGVPAFHRMPIGFSDG